MLLPNALRRVAVVAATASLLAVVPLAAANAAETVTNVTPTGALNDGEKTIAFDTSATYLPVAKPSVKLVRTADSADVITVDPVDVTVSANHFTVVADLANRNPGPWNIVVSGATATAAETVSSCTSCYTILALGPDITTTSPTSVRINQAGASLTVNGKNFTTSNYCTSGPCEGQPTLRVSGTGVTLTGSDAATPTAITKGITVAPTAATGFRDLTVTNTDGKTDTCTNCLLIAPEVTGVTYSENTGVTSYGQGAVDRTLTIAGNGFQPGAVVAFASSAGITKNATRVVNGNTIEVDLTLAQVGSTPPGTGNHAITVTNPDGGTHASSVNFNITTGPAITDVTPQFRGRGTTSTITFDGTGFSTGGVDILIPDATVTPISTTSTKVTATVVVGNGLNIAGDRDVTLINKGDKGQFVCVKCFTITNLQIDSVSPNNVLNDGPQVVTINGSGIASDAKATLFKSGQTNIAGTTTEVDGNGNWMKVSFPVTNAAPGGWGIRVDNPTTNPGTGSCNCTLNVVAAAPSITKAEPAVVGSGADNEPVVLTGSNFFPGVTVDFTNPGVTIVKQTVTPTQISLEVDIARGSEDAPVAVPGEEPRIVVTNTDGQSDSVLFKVTKAPTATSVSPSSRARGTSTTIVLSGSDIENGATLLVSGNGLTLGTPVVTQGATPNEDDKVSVPAQIANDADLTSRTVTVRNPDGGLASCATCTVTITAQPTVTSVSPDKAPAGTTKAYTVNGTGFSTGATVDPGTGVTATVTAVTPTALTVSLNVAPAATLGMRSLKVTNTDGGSATLADAYEVIALPGAPTGVTAERGSSSGTVLVKWTAPSTDGGDPITKYTVVAEPGGRTMSTADGSARQLVVTELVNGTPYTFKVFATNAAGDGPASDASNSATPATVPGAPTAVLASDGDADGTANVSWTAPLTDGGSPITGYRVTADPGGATEQVTGTSAVVDNLINGTEYTFTVVAINAAGESAPSAKSNAVTPAGVPGAPTDVDATAGNTSAVVTWAASPSNGSDVIEYVVTSSPDGKTATTTDGDTLTATVTGLTNGTAYTFTVVARNAKGLSEASAPSDAVTPHTVPGAPTGVVATAGDKSAHVVWEAPADNGSAITGYTVKSSPGDHTVEVGPDARAADFTGLTNGTAYTFTVIAENAAGDGAASAPSNSVTPAGLPGQPAVSAAAGHAAATVNWTTPADNGSPITGYTVTATPGGATKTVTGNTTTFTGLTNGTSYTFKVVANNAVGSGPAGTSNAVVPTWVTSLTSAATRVVGTGGTANFKGALTRSDGVGVVGATVEIYRRVTPSSTFTFLKTVRTGTGGNWATGVTVTKNTYFQARFLGVNGYDPASSPIRLTQARYKVTASYARSARTITATGVITPNAAGRSVYIRQRKADGSLVTLAKGTVAANGSYRLVRTLNPGSYRVFVYIGNSTTNVAGSSPTVTLTIP